MLFWKKKISSKFKDLSVTFLMLMKDKSKQIYFLSFTLYNSSIQCSNTKVFWQQNNALFCLYLSIFWSCFYVEYEIVMQENILKTGCTAGVEMEIQHFKLTFKRENPVFSMSNDARKILSMYWVFWKTQSLNLNWYSKFQKRFIKFSKYEKYVYILVSRVLSFCHQRRFSWLNSREEKSLCKEPLRPGK